LREITLEDLPLSSKIIDELYDQLLDFEYRNIPLCQIFSGLKPMAKSLNRVSMSTRARNVLLRQNINSLRELGTFTISEINDFRNSGSGTMFEIVSLYLQQLEDDKQEMSTEENLMFKTQNYDDPHNESYELQRIPSDVLKFLAQISNDLSLRDLHVINARSEVGGKLTHGAVAENWGITRQRIHQIENHLIQSFRNEKLLGNIRDMILPLHTFRGSTELVNQFPWLNLGVAIHPIGASILQILIFSRLVNIDKGWIFSNEESSFQRLMQNLMEENRGDASGLFDLADISPEILEYLQGELSWIRSSQNVNMRGLSSAHGQTSIPDSYVDEDLLLDRFLAGIKKGEH
jgi:hypothetical protein